MRLLFFLLVLTFPVIVPAQAPATADSIYLETPKQTVKANDTLPAYLRLYSDGTFEYWQMPWYSCWIMSTTRGTWRMEEGLLRLEFDDYYFDEEMRAQIKPGVAFFRINGNELTRHWPSTLPEDWSRIGAGVLQADRDLPSFLAKNAEH